MIRGRKRFFPVTISLGLLAIWELLGNALDVPEYVLPTPSKIVLTLLSENFEMWAMHTLETLKISVIGFSVSLIVSLILSSIMTYVKLVRDGIFPLLVVVQSTPIVAIAPLLIVILGTGDAPRIVIVFLITFFPIVVSTTTGLSSTPKDYIELSQSLNASAIRELFHIRFPYAVPYIFSGLKVAITLSIVGTVVAEFIAADKGLGYYIQFSTSFFSIPQAFAGLVILLLLSLTLFYLVEFIQKLLFPWSLKNQKPGMKES